MRILIDQEYGWKYWLWTPPTYVDVDKLVGMMTWSLEHDPDFNPADFVEEDTSGTWKQIEWDEYKDIRKSREWDAIGHFHEHDDSWLAPLETYKQRVGAGAQTTVSIDVYRQRWIDDHGR